MERRLFFKKKGVGRQNAKGNRPKGIRQNSKGKIQKAKGKKAKGKRQKAKKQKAKGQRQQQKSKSQKTNPLPFGGAGGIFMVGYRTSPLIEKKFL